VSTRPASAVIRERPRGPLASARRARCDLPAGLIWIGATSRSARRGSTAACSRARGAGRCTRACGGYK